jgi:hypothetical protein
MPRFLGEFAISALESLIADFRGRENNQAFGGQAPRSFGNFFISVPRSLIIFPAQGGSVGYVSPTFRTSRPHYL